MKDAAEISALATLYPREFHRKRKEEEARHETKMCKCHTGSGENCPLGYDPNHLQRRPDQPWDNLVSKSFVVQRIIRLGTWKTRDGNKVTLNGVSSRDVSLSIQSDSLCKAELIQIRDFLSELIGQME